MSADINISNYESYLYCYVDGELNAEETAALERFISANPQVRAELELLMATRLRPEVVVFDAKASLYRGSEIHLQNYEGYLLSYIDGELDPAEEEALEQFMASHPKVRQELVMWQGTKQHADPSIRFDDKSVLYRHSKPRTFRMRTAYWWAAAAMIAGVLAFLGLSDRYRDQQALTPLAGVEKVPPAANMEPYTTTDPEEQAPDSRVTVKGEALLPSVAPTAPDSRTATTVGEDAAEPVTPVLAQTTAKPGAATPRLQREQSQQAVTKTATSSSSINLDNLPAAEKATALTDRRELDAALSATPKEMPGTKMLAAAKPRPSLDEQAPPAALATPAPAAAEPGELILSVTGNGLESKVLDKVSNVARFFSKKKK